VVPYNASPKIGGVRIMNRVETILSG
jgi:hypothetical protein